jgi:hypothetical protein
MRKQHGANHNFEIDEKPPILFKRLGCANETEQPIKSKHFDNFQAEGTLRRRFKVVDKQIKAERKREEHANER